MVNIGDAVIYVDPVKIEHRALVTQVWGSVYPNSVEPTKPGVNVVLISADPNKDDQYGRQIERQTSIVHISVQPAKANCWKDI